MTPPVTHARVRRFVDEDIPHVAELHRRVFVNAPARKVPVASYRKYFEEVFLRPADHGVLTSLVYERQGDIRGFLGVAPLAMRFKRSPILAAVCSQFVVDPKERGLAGLQMLKTCFAGPQDLSIADEAGDNARKMWEWCGGTAVLPYSIYWVRPLQPAQAAFALIGRHMRKLPCRAGLTRVARLFDLLAGRQASRRMSIVPIRGSREDLDENTFLAGFAEFCGRRAIGPDYTAQSVALMFGRLTGGRNDRVVRKQLVRDESGKAIGSFIYVIADDGVAEVLHVAARTGSGRLVLDQLAVDARTQGAVAVTGTLDSELTPELSEKHSFLYRRGHWTLAYSRDAELMHALQRGDASVSRLQGEWCLRFP
jgi:hypothetical protein